MKKNSKKSASPLPLKLVLFVFVILLGVWFFTPNKMGVTNKSNEVTAQLSPAASKTGMGTALKNYENSKYTLNVYGVLPKPAKGKEYFVWFKEGKTNSAEVMLVGKMVASGDVYSLSYSSDKRFDYKKVVITEQLESETKSGNLTGEVLSGGFAK